MKMLFTEYIVLVLLINVMGCHDSSQPIVGITDTTAPTASSTFPANSATDVPINTKITTIFSEAINPLTITAATFVVTGPGTTPVSGTVICAGATATFTPTGNLTGNTTFTATITNGAKDLAGNALASNYVWSFTTGTTSVVGPAPVSLGTAGNYVILAKTGISTTGANAVTQPAP